MFNESIKMALDGMFTNKLRTFLTLLGIIIGVGAVIAMVSLGFGVKEQIKSNISSLGSNLLIVMSGGRTPSGARLPMGEGARLTAEDAEAIEKQIDGIAHVAPSVSRSYQLVAGNQNWTASVEGTTPNVLDIRNYQLEEGRNLNQRDLTSRDRVCVIGQTIVENLFPDGNALGKTVRINKAPFKVVGVLQAMGQSSSGQDQDDVVFIPLTTAQNRMMGITYISRITIQAENENVIDQVQADVEALLRVRHKIQDDEYDDFTVRNLFFNTPARRKFLKSDNVEFRHIVEEFTRVAVTRPDTAFTLTHNGREIFVLRKEKSLKYRITNLLGSGLADDVVDISAHSSIADISGFIGRPQTARKTAGNQFFFVNGRFFRSGYLHKAVLNAYENLIPEGTSPSYLIFIETDPHSVDVNIHPTKTEVKFEDEQMLFQLLSASVRETLGRNSFRAGLNFETDKAVEIPQIGRFYDEYRPVEAPGIEFDPDYDPFRAAGGASAAGVPAPEGRETPSGGWSPVSPARGKAAPADGYGKLFEDRPGAVSRTLIIGGRYVVTPAASGMMVVNIRRATERILYERTLKALSGAREHVSQTTLFPVELRLGVERRLVIDEHADLLARIGFDIKPCGEDSISVEGVPEGYSSSPGDVQSAVEELTDILSQEGGALQEIMNQRLAGKIAASGAAGAEKIGTPLQAQRLIDTLFECDNAEATADGRRTVNIISTEDIDKLF